MKLILMMVAILVIIWVWASVPTKKLIDGGDLSIIFIFFQAGVLATIGVEISEYIKSKKSNQ